MQKDQARLFVNEGNQYEIAMFNFDPSQERVRLRNEKGREFDCRSRKESEGVVRRAWKARSWRRFREQIR